MKLSIIVTREADNVDSDVKKKKGGRGCNERLMEEAASQLKTKDFCRLTFNI